MMKLGRNYHQMNRNLSMSSMDFLSLIYLSIIMNYCSILSSVTSKKGIIQRHIKV